MITNFKTNKEIIALSKNRNKHVYKCKCGHSVVIYPMEHKTRKLCSFCGKYVYINKCEEFKAKLKEKLK